VPQCAEKYLKALLISRQIDPQKIHYLTDLYAQLPDGQLVDFDVRLLEELNPYSIEGRYPGVWGPVEQAEALRAVEAVRTIRQAIRRVLLPVCIV
jgi:HEPN domain-containing protein